MKQPGQFFERIPGNSDSNGSGNPIIKDRTSQESHEKLPVVSFKNPLKLIRVDIENAFFQDATGKYWNMNIKEQSWKELNEIDISPMKLQFSIPIEIEKSNFGNIEDAINYAQRLYFEREMENALLSAEYFKKTNNIDKDEVAAVFRDYATRYKAIVNLMKKYEDEKEIEIKKILIGQIILKVNEFKVFNGGQL